MKAASLAIGLLTLRRFVFIKSITVQCSVFIEQLKLGNGSVEFVMNGREASFTRRAQMAIDGVKTMFA